MSLIILSVFVTLGRPNSDLGVGESGEQLSSGRAPADGGTWCELGLLLFRGGLWQFVSQVGQSLVALAHQVPDLDTLPIIIKN